MAHRFFGDEGTSTARDRADRHHHKRDNAKRIRRGTRKAVLMDDLIFIGIVVVFFIGSGLYVRFCENL